MHHGQAVAIDTALTVTLCEQRGLLAKAERDRVIALLRAVGLPITSELLTLDRCRQALDEAVLHRGGAVNLVAPTAIGEATFIERREEVTSELLEQALARLAFDAAAPGMVAA
jgi:3-dehydroquinate synthase